MEDLATPKKSWCWIGSSSPPDGTDPASLRISPPHGRVHPRHTRHGCRDAFRLGSQCHCRSRQAMPASHCPRRESPTSKSVTAHSRPACNSYQKDEHSAVWANRGRTRPRGLPARPWSARAIPSCLRRPGFCNVGRHPSRSSCSDRATAPRRPPFPGPGPRRHRAPAQTDLERDSPLPMFAVFPPSFQEWVRQGWTDQCFRQKVLWQVTAQRPQGLERPLRPTQMFGLFSFHTIFGLVPQCPEWKMAHGEARFSPLPAPKGRRPRTMLPRFTGGAVFRTPLGAISSLRRLVSLRLARRRRC